MATTETLETTYWLGRREHVVQDQPQTRKVRIFLVPRSEYDALVPSRGDTASDDTDYVVIGTTVGRIRSAVLCEMHVLYEKRTGYVGA